MRYKVLSALLAILMVMGVPAAFAQGDDEEKPFPGAYTLNTANIRHEYQGWNNCGPTTMTMGLTYFGYTPDQNPAARFMKPHTEDKNVNPWEMTAYVNEMVTPEQGATVQALYRVGGNFDLLRTLISNEFAVIIEKGYEPEGYDWMGHYLFLVGYDDNQQVFVTYDSFLGPGLQEPYAKIENYWWHFNNTFIVLYEPHREEELMTLLGEWADLERAYQIAFEVAQERAAVDGDNSWNWFNMGDALTKLGYYEQATEYFRVALDKGMPWRTLWYRHTPFEAFYQTGHFQTVLQLVNQAKQTTPFVEEFHYWHGMVFASQGRTADARAQFNQALFYNRNHQPSIDAIAALDNNTFVPVEEVTPQ